MKLAVRIFQLPLLVALIAGCTILASIVWYYFGQRYEVRVELPFSRDIEIFKDAEPTLKSANAFVEFARVRGLTSSPEAARLHSQLSRGGGGSVSIFHEFQLSKASVRDLPDALAAASLVQNLATESKAPKPISSSIIVSATAATSQEALRMARIAMDFVRYALVQRALNRNIAEWRHFGAKLTDRDFGSSIADLDSVILAHETMIASLDRKIAAMTTLRDGQKVNTAGAAPVGSAVQVQVSGPDFLPIDQQIVGMQAQRITTIENLMSVRMELAKKEAFRSFGNEVASVTAAEPDPLKALDQAVARAEDFRIKAQTVPEQQAADALRSALASTRSRYIEIETNPQQASAARAGIGGTTALAIGAATGVIAWMCILYLLLVWRQRFGRHNSGVSTPDAVSPHKEQHELSLAS